MASQYDMIVRVPVEFGSAADAADFIGDAVDSAMRYRGYQGRAIVRDVEKVRDEWVDVVFDYWT